MKVGFEAGAGGPCDPCSWLRTAVVDAWLRDWGESVSERIVGLTKVRVGEGAPIPKGVAFLLALFSKQGAPAALSGELMQEPRLHQ